MTARLLTLLAATALLAAACGDDAVPTAGTGGTGGGPAGGGPTEVSVVLDGGEFDHVAYTVACGPDGPSVEPAVPGVDPQQACERLADDAVATRLVEGPPADRVCTEVYGGPQQATITGTIGGRTVDARITRTNGCEIDTWDRLLAGLLPPTEGVQAEG